MRAAILAALGLAALAAGRAQAETLCENPNRFCGRFLSTECLQQRLGAGARAAGEVDCGAQMEDYQSCLLSAAQCPSAGGQTASAGCDAQISRELWDLAVAEEDCAGFEAYLAECPNARRARFARIRLRKLGCDGQGKTAEGQAGPPPVAAIAVPGAVDFGDDSSKWANDGECDDPRFIGDKVDGILLEADMMHDATDCRTLLQAGAIRVRVEGE